MTGPYEHLGARELLDARNMLAADQRDPDGRFFLHLARRLLATRDRDVGNLMRQLNAQSVDLDVAEHVWIKKEAELREGLRGAIAREESLRNTIDQRLRDVYQEAYARGKADHGSNGARADREALQTIADVLIRGKSSTVSANRAIEIAKARLNTP